MPVLKLRIGVDVGSTTTKMVALDETGTIRFEQYVRHQAKALESVVQMLREVATSLPREARYQLRITGSIGMGIAERSGFPFVQEVVAAAKTIQTHYPEVRSMIDIGGEDAKVVFFQGGVAQDLRMNGNCAGGTGAFIDQMAVLLDCSVSALSDMALKATQVYPIASRCGVFCKTDIQNLIAKNVPREDIAASIFRAVAVQTVMTLAHGCDILRPLLFCGGPLTYLPALRKAFVDYMSIQEGELILPERGTLLPAEGAALAQVGDEEYLSVDDVIARLQQTLFSVSNRTGGLSSIFSDEVDREEWMARMSRCQLPKSQVVTTGDTAVFLGIDSGSTTTKIVVLDHTGAILFDYYAPNGGNPIGAVTKGLQQIAQEAEARALTLRVIGACSTGYGEDLIRAAFGLDFGIIETIAHFLAARYIDPEVSFILDIGGQDMKAIFVEQGVISRMEINEACSSGCGSFLFTFAGTMGYDVATFAGEACHSQHPCDLGTRCTVFMNSKVKQVLREGATVADLSAGLAYSVVRNCLYKVLKLKHTSELGSHIVVQGGTMRNDAVVRALERLTGVQVSRCDKPELMGAYGCALYAKTCTTANAVAARTFSQLLSAAVYTQKNVHCHGCENQCLVATYHFAGGKTYFSGNRCEKIFTNGAVAKEKGQNVYDEKQRLLFDGATTTVDTTKPQENVVGIPRALGQFEEFPFWRTLFEQAGLQVVLSAPSDYRHYEREVGRVMSDNICFPAKLMHSHIRNLANEGVHRVFLPFVLYERPAGGQNSFNCPIVSGYGEVVKAVQGTVAEIVSPTISFKDEKLLKVQCESLLRGLGVGNKRTIQHAFTAAVKAHTHFETQLETACRTTLQRAQAAGRMVILLAGRPYHTDPLIQHKVSDMIAGMGIDVITDDIVRSMDIDLSDVHHVSQWAYPTRILKAAKWCATQVDNVHFVQFTSFGCGPDAFLVDEVRDLMNRYHKSYTLLKLDDINNVGSMKLRIRSLIESLKISTLLSHHEAEPQTLTSKSPKAFVTSPVFDETMRGRKLLVPFFTQFISPLIPSVMQLAGYDVDTLPLSDELSGDLGLQYANNEVCYPATLIVGDFVKAFREGKYDPDHTAVLITQTGGQCRASNYISLIKKALVDAGFPTVPVVSLTMGEDLGNMQPGFHVQWRKIIGIAFNAVVYSDLISKFFYPTAVREKEKGIAVQLRDRYLQLGAEAIRRHDSKRLRSLAAEAAEAFNDACVDRETSKVGVVGEIFLKFHPFAQKHVVDWLIERGIEVAPPVMLDFFTQAFVNRKVYLRLNIERSHIPEFLIDSLYKIVRRMLNKANTVGERFRYYRPFHDIVEEAKAAEPLVSLSAQFGEGWLLPAEIAEYAREGINHVVSLQPFGCIANHIVARGVERRIKQAYPDLSLLSIDFDSGVSEVNITNRLLLFIDDLPHKA